MPRIKKCIIMVKYTQVCNVFIFFMFCRYPDKEQLQAIYGAYLTPILNRQLGRHPVWGNPAKVYALAGSMVQLYEQV